MHVAELKSQDFTTERFGHLVESVVWEAGRTVNLRHFFENWQLWMDFGIARTWAAEGCILGALIAPDVFSGVKRASVIFWFSLPSVRKSAVTGRVFKVFEDAVREAGCVDIQSAAHAALDPLGREAGYLRHGFVKSETVYTKELT